MSWFRRKPTVKEHTAPVSHRYSPATQRLLTETKKAVKPTLPPKKPQWIKQYCTLCIRHGNRTTTRLWKIGQCLWKWPGENYVDLQMK